MAGCKSLSENFAIFFRIRENQEMNGKVVKAYQKILSYFLEHGRIERKIETEKRKEENLCQDIQNLPTSNIKKKKMMRQEEKFLPLLAGSLQLP